MTKQTRHMRHSRKGKPYWAGSRKHAPYINPVPVNEHKYPVNISKDINISLPKILGTFKVIAGSTGQGKSNTLAVVMEEYLKYHMPVHIIDVEGEHLSFQKDYPQVALLNKEKYDKMSQKHFVNYIKLILNSRLSLILDLSTFDEEKRFKFLKDYLDVMWHLEDSLRVPVAIIAEEAHVLVPQVGTTIVKPRMVDIAKRGRKRKMELVLVTQRIQDVNKSVVTQAGTAFLHKVTHPTDLGVYKALIPSKALYDSVPKLKVGEIIFINHGEAVKGFVRRRTTAHGSETISVAELKPPFRFKGGK